MSVLAVIFDFDDTLLPDSTSALLEAHGLDPSDFWSKRAKPMVRDQGYDPPLAYLNLLLSEVGLGLPLGELTNAALRAFGATLDEAWFPGLPDLFNDLRAIAGEYRDVSVEFYIISGGLQPIIEGSKHVQDHFSGVYGCQLGEDIESKVVSDIKRCVTFTEKTRFLFEINKGVQPEAAAANPNLVNGMIAEDARPVPFRNMIYVGDGQTDIPCFSLVQKGGGTAFGVFQPGRESAKQAFQEFLETGRVNSLHHPEYGEDDELGSMIRAAVASTCARIVIDSAGAL